MVTSGVFAFNKTALHNFARLFLCVIFSKLLLYKNLLQSSPVMIIFIA